MCQEISFKLPVSFNSHSVPKIEWEGDMLSGWSAMLASSILLISDWWMFFSRCCVDGIFFASQLRLVVYQSIYFNAWSQVLRDIFHQQYGNCRTETPRIRNGAFPPTCFVRLTFCHVIIVISSNNPMFLFGGWVKYSNSPRYPLVSKYGSRKWTFWSISYWKWGFQLPCYLFHQRVQVPASFLHLWIWRWVIARKAWHWKKSTRRCKCISGKLQHGDFPASHVS